MAEKASTKPKRWAKVKEYFRGIRAEVKKVVWPTKKETYRYTAVVLVTCVLFAFFFWILDTGFLKLLEVVLNISM